MHHIRRYGRRQVLTLFDAPDIDLVRFTAFNLLLAPIAVLYRAAERLLRIDFGNQERHPPAVLNAVLKHTFALESVLLRHGMAVPLGLSYAAVFRRKPNLAQPKE